MTQNTYHGKKNTKLKNVCREFAVSRNTVRSLQHDYFWRLMGRGRRGRGGAVLRRVEPRWGAGTREACEVASRGAGAVAEHLPSRRPRPNPRNL